MVEKEAGKLRARQVAVHVMRQVGIRTRESPNQNACFVDKEIACLWPLSSPTPTWPITGYYYC